MSQQHASLRTQYMGSHSLTANVCLWDLAPEHYEGPPPQPKHPHYMGKTWGGCMKLLLFGLLALMVLGGVIVAMGAVS